jgi:hypothetical protein
MIGGEIEDDLIRSAGCGSVSGIVRRRAVDRLRSNAARVHRVAALRRNS